jgi:hypothetical protein
MDVRTAARMLLAALETDGRQWKSSNPGKGCSIGVPSRSVIQVDEIVDGVSVSLQDPELRERKLWFAAHDEEELHLVLERVVSSARAWADRLSILQLGRRAYRVRRSFGDFYGSPFAEGEVLHFVERKFLPYHGGHTIVFRERSLFVQEEVNASFLRDLDLYLEEA